jgi:hypothetical protein
LPAGFLLSGSQARLWRVLWLSFSQIDEEAREMVRNVIFGLAILGLLALSGVQILISLFFPIASFGALFSDATYVGKLTMLLTLLLAAPTLCLAVLIRRRWRLLFLLLSAFSAGFGAIGALVQFQLVQNAVRAVGVVSFQTVAPGYAEALLILGVGCLAAMVAALRELIAIALDRRAERANVLEPFS